MEPKKTIKADLTRKSFLFFNLGLIMTLLMAVMAFNYRVYDDTSKIDLDRTSFNPDELQDVPLTEHLPPPPPRLELQQIIEVEDDKDIVEDLQVNLDVETDMFERVEEVRVDVVVEDKEDPNMEFRVVEQGATPKDGFKAFNEYLSKNLRYPPQARRMHIEGKVFVEFVVEKDGTLTDVHWIKGIGGGCDEEAVRVLKNAPLWNPGKQRGKPVRQRMVLPVVFQLN